jgi:tryptophan synthase alpha chain
VNALDRSFDAKLAAKKKLLVPFVTAGFPGKGDTPAIVQALEAAGADAVELGIPFSDPLADGPVIQRASQRALENGVTLTWALDLAAELAKTISIPLLVMGYANPIERFGQEKFAARCGEAGITGVIVPDLPLDEARSLTKRLLAAKVHSIPLAAPTTTPERLARIGKATTAFLYCVSIAGTTGGKGGLPPELEAFLERTRAVTKKPRLVGFGIGDAATAARAARTSDGVIVGSALLEALAAAKDPADAARQFLATLRAAL